MKLIARTTMVLGGCMFSVLSLSAQANQAFIETLISACGSVYVGTMTFPTEGQDSFMGKTLVADLAHCSENKVSIPFAVGDDKSRTWHISLEGQSLSLKHEHRHDDGSLDEVTDYGGTAINQSSALSQSFPADAHTKTLIPDAATNVWTLTFSEDKQTLTYHLERHDKPRFTAVLKRR